MEQVTNCLGILFHEFDTCYGDEDVRKYGEVTITVVHRVMTVHHSSFCSLTFSLTSLFFCYFCLCCLVSFYFGFCLFRLYLICFVFTFIFLLYILVQQLIILNSFYLSLRSYH